MGPLDLERLPLENRVKVPAEPPGIAGVFVPVLALRAPPVSGGTALLDTGLHRLGMERKASFEMRFQLGLRGPMPVATAAEAMDFHQPRPEIPGRVSRFRRLLPFRLGKDNTIDEDRRLLHASPPFLDAPLFLLYTWSMANSSDYRTGRHCVFALHVHLVFVSKYRRLVFTKEIGEDLRTIFSDVCQDFEATLEEFDGERDHVHLLITYPPKVAISRLVNSLKGVSSRMIRKKHYPSIERALWGGNLWSPSYFAGSAGGAPLSIIREYIEQQDTPD